MQPRFFLRLEGISIVREPLRQSDYLHFGSWDVVGVAPPSCNNGNTFDGGLDSGVVLVEFDVWR